MSGGGAGGVKERPRPHAEARTSDPDLKKIKCLVFLHPEGHDPRNRTFSFFCFRHDFFVWDAVVSLFVAELYFQNNTHLWFLLSLVRPLQRCLQP